MFESAVAQRRRSAPLRQCKLSQPTDAVSGLCADNLPYCPTALLISRPEFQVISRVELLKPLS